MAPWKVVKFCVQLESFNSEPGYHLDCSCSLFIMVIIASERIVAVQFLYTYAQSPEELYSVK